MTHNHTSAKAKLFALHLGQKVYCHDALDENPYSLNVSDLVVVTLIEKGCLQLRTIADLTDEEFEQVAVLMELVERISDSYTKIDLKTLGMCVIKEAFGVNVTNYFTSDTLRKTKVPDNILKLSDYLRSIGCALPFTVLEDGKPRTYSVQEQCELNWIQLIGI